MSDPFLSASRRIIRRLGTPITIIVDGVPLEPAPLGIFDYPEGDRLHKGKRGELSFIQRRPTLITLTESAAHLDNRWLFVIGGMEYFAADHHDDGHGCTRIFLAKNTHNAEENPKGSKWR